MRPQAFSKLKHPFEDADSLATGAQVKLYVTSSKAENVMMIPTDAIYYQGGKAMVYTYKDNAVHEVPVEVGIYDAEKTEITGGLQHGG